jgi:protein-L-isoaspartate(D-aspartate) O-methyltransferase
VRSVELHEPIAALARENLATLPGATPVEILTADAMTLSEQGSYDAIVVNASLPVYVTRFQQALRPGGRMFVVVGSGEPQQAYLVRCTSTGEFVREPLFETLIEPLEHAPTPSVFRF